LFPIWTWQIFVSGFDTADFVSDLFAENLLLPIWTRQIFVSEFDTADFVLDFFTENLLFAIWTQEIFVSDLDSAIFIHVNVKHLCCYVMPCLGKPKDNNDFGPPSYFEYRTQ
jgi:hypothetical protein